MNRDQLQNAGDRRVTHYINRRPAVNIHHATRFSERIGTPLNHFVTINFTCAGCDPEQAVALLRKMISQRFAPWLRRTAQTTVEIAPTYVWCMEAAGEQHAAHILVHIPDDLQKTFESHVERWLKGLLGVDELEPGTIKMKAVYNLIGVRRYMLKGVDPAWAKHLGIRAMEQGVVIGKRSAFSRNLGPAARQRGGYRPKRIPPRSH